MRARVRERCGPEAANLSDAVRHFVGLGCLVLFASAGCPGPEPGGSDENVRAAMSPSAPDSLRLRLDAPTEVRAGQPVPIIIALENRGTRPLELYLRGRVIAFDIRVTRAGGETVWQRLRDQIIPAVIQVKVLQPGEILELRDEWNQRTDEGERAGPGDYSVRGSILTDGPSALETPPAQVRILPPP